VAKLVVVDGAAKGFEYRLSSSPVMIGSSREADISLSENFVSKFHARLEHSGGRYVLFDLDSARGTFVNDSRIHNKILSHGDHLRIGNTTLLFKEKALDSRLGKTFGKFKILGTLGSGGMGTVYLAQQMDIDRLVALKVLKQSLTQDPHYVERFQREASTALGLIHKNIVQAYEVGSDDSTYFFSMEYINGPTLYDVLKDERMLEPPRAVDMTIQVAEALDYASRVGIVHLDVKPRNVLLTPSSLVKVADFGISRLVGEQMQAAARKGKRQTVVGSRYYMAPEQIMGEAVDSRTDIYSLGASLYHMVTGRPPFVGTKGADIYRQHLRTMPRPAYELVDSLSSTLSTLIAKMLEKDPTHRFLTPAALIAALRDCRKRMN